MIIGTILAFIIVLGVLVFVHEFGHFIVAKSVGIYVEEFSLGLGPLIWKRQGAETQYSIRSLPLGGYCKMAGDNPHDDKITGTTNVDQERIPEHRMFYAKTVWQRALVVAAGPIMNFIVAALIFGVIFMILGIPTALSNKPIIGEISPGGPAAQAGLLPGDRILSVDGIKVESWDQLAEQIRSKANQDVILKVQRGEVIFETVVQPRQERPDGPGLIGIVPKAEARERVPLHTALWYGLLQTFHLLIALVVGLFELLTGKLTGPIAGPVGIAKMAGQAARFGLESLLNLTAVLSVNLGVLNLLPFPALDGGRLAFLGVEVLRRKPVDPEREGLVHFIGFALLMLLILFITFREVVSLF
ncbi:MAG: RIP metalloprotease RseP [Firmicutes bacterium]|nr:RIP metalloprotease RseP [Bacillota bacterium]